jgi:uncharacterized protein (DUF849 family)
MSKLPASFRDTPNELPKKEADNLYALFQAEMNAIPETYTPALTYALDTELQKEREEQEKERAQVAILWAEMLKDEIQTKQSLKQNQKPAQQQTLEIKTKNTDLQSQVMQDIQHKHESSDDEENEVQLVRKTVQEKVRQVKEQDEKAGTQPEIDSDDEGNAFTFKR